jgi:hypothetical protein
MPRDTEFPPAGMEVVGYRWMDTSCSCNGVCLLPSAERAEEAIGSRIKRHPKHRKCKYAVEFILKDRRGVWSWVRGESPIILE